MIPRFPSSESLNPRRNPPNRDHLFTNILSQQQRYRLRTHEYLKTYCCIRLWLLFWMTTILIVIGHLISIYFMLQSFLLPFMLGFIGSGLKLIYVSKRRANIGKMIQYSTLLLALYLLGCCIVCLCNQKVLIYPTSIYIPAEVIGSMFLLTNRSQLIGKLLILFQLLILILKMDESIQSSWQQVLFGVLVAFFLCLASILSMISFFVVNYCCFKEPCASIKHTGLFYIIIQTSCFFCLTGTALAQKVYQLENAIIFSILLGLFILFLGFFSIKQSEKIALFFCKVQKVKNNNQIISLIEIPQQKLQNCIFVKKSQNWYHYVSAKSKKNLQKQINQLKIERQQFTLGQEKCLICLDEDPNVIWMPCGHLCVCESCCAQMIFHKNSCCVLCKDIPEAIYFVKQDKQKQDLELSHFQCQIVSEIIIEDQLQKDKNKRFQSNLLSIVKAFSVKIL